MDVEAPAPDRPGSWSDAERRAAVGALACATLFWGSTFFLMKEGSAAIAGRLPAGTGRWAPLLFLALRFTLAAAVFPMVFPFIVKRARAALGWGIVTGIPFVGGFILQIYGLAETDPSVSALLTSMFVVFTPLGVLLLFRRPPGRHVALGISFALAGLWLITGAKETSLGRGEILSLLCAVVFSGHIIATDVGTRRVDPIAIAWNTTIFAAVACIVPLLFVRPSPFPAVPAILASGRVLTGLLITALLATVASIALMNHFQKRLSPNRAAVVYTLEPVFAGIFSWIFFGEVFGERKLLGGALILAGNFVCGLKRDVPRDRVSGPGASA